MSCGPENTNGSRGEIDGNIDNRGSTKQESLIMIIQLTHRSFSVTDYIKYYAYLYYLYA
jgi:hypothetical protein